jgi:hypothetical protein
MRVEEATTDAVGREGDPARVGPLAMRAGPTTPHPGAAPPFDCAECGRRIGKAKSHWLLRDGQAVVCASCYLHRHDADEAECSGTRAGIAARLGLWP